MIRPVFSRTVEGGIMRRWLLCGVALVAMGLEAGAADMPDFLRGSQPVIAMSGGPRWDASMSAATSAGAYPASTSAKRRT